MLHCQCLSTSFRSCPRILLLFFFFFFNDTATTEIYTLSLHDALPICVSFAWGVGAKKNTQPKTVIRTGFGIFYERFGQAQIRSEEHTSELQSRQYLVCRLLLEKKKKTSTTPPTATLPYHLRSSS